MAIRARATGSGTDSLTHSVSMPAGVQTGDRLVCAFVNDQTDTSTVSGTPSGWSIVGTQAQGSNFGLTVFTRVATASNTLTVTLTTAQQAAWVVICLQADGGTPQIQFANGPNATNGAVTAITGLASGNYDSLLFLGLDNNLQPGHTISTTPAGWGNLTTPGTNTEAVCVYSADQTGTGVTGFSPGDFVWTNADQWVTAHVVVPVFSSTVTKSGSDSSTGSEAGGVTATVPGGDSATGSESGKLALIGGDSATGSETGYVSEGKIGGDSSTGTETGTTTGTVTSGEATTGSESGTTSATLTPPATDTATGSEGGHIAIPGEDTATGVDAHLPPTHVTVTFGDEATGSEGGHVETLFGNLIVNLYGIDPDNGSLIPLPDYTTLRFSRQRNDKGAVSVDYPVNGKNFDLLRGQVTANRDLEIELWTNGTPVQAMRGYLQEASGDDVTEGSVWTFAGSFLEIRMDEAVVYPQDLGPQIVDPDTGELTYTNPRRELIINADNPGEVMTLIVEQAQDRGTLTDLTLDFTTTLDSGGNPWAGLLTANYSPGATYTQILNAMVDLGLCEWAIEWNGTAQVLKLWNAEGRGADLTLGPRPIILRRGRNLLDAPRRWSVRDAGTTMLAAGSEGIYDDWDDATALARRGRRIEKFATLQNASDEEAVLAFAQAELATNAPGTLSVDHSIGMLPGEPRPIVAFNIGDWVYSQVGTETERLRVVQWEVSIDANRQLSGNVALNDTIQDAIERLREQLNAIQSGQAVVGTSEPPPQVEDRTPPAAPEGVVAESIAYQDPLHGEGQTLAMVTVGWLPVTTNADGADNPLVQTAVFVLDKIQDDIANPPVPDPEQEDGGPDYDPFDPATWTWKNCPQIVQDFAAQLRALWVEDGSTDTQTWLSAYIAEASQVPTAAQDVAGYNVRYSYLGIEQVGGLPSSDPFPEADRFYYEATPPTGTSSTSYSFGGVEGGSRLRIEVRAFDRNGNFGAWTTISHDCANDTTPPPVPAGPDGFKAWFKTLDIPWNGLGVDGEVMPVDFSHVRVWVGQGSDMTLPAEPVGDPVQFNPAVTTPQYVAQLFGAGTWNLPDVPLGIGWYARLQAVDHSGNASAGSTIAGPIFVEQLVSDDLIDDIIDATKLGPNSVESAHIVNGAITTAKILDANIVTAKIANLAVNDAKIADLSVGKLQTGTMIATVTVTGSLWTNTDPNATRLGFSSAGLQLYRSNSPAAGSTLIGYWRTSDGNMLVTGTFQSALSGPRIMIDPDGSFRIYPDSGTNYSQIKNESGEMVWRGPLNGSSYSGRVNVNVLGVGLNFSQEKNLLGTITSEIVVFDGRQRLQAPFINLVVDDAGSNPAGGTRRVQFHQVSSGGSTLSNSQISYQTDSDDWGGFAGNDTGWKLARLGPSSSGRFTLTNGVLGGDQGVGLARGWEISSSEAVKDDVGDIREVLDPTEVIRNARARKFRYNEQPPDGELSMGIIAEELPDVLRREITKEGGERSYAIDLGSQIGVLWGAFNQVLEQEIVATTGTILYAADHMAPGATVEVPATWDSKPPTTPTGGFVQVHAYGLTGWIKTGSVTATGCTVVLKNITGAPLNNSQVNATVIGLGLFTPPYNTEE